jgi:mono/diheme cytochrome c family protein
MIKVRMKTFSALKWTGIAVLVPVIGVLGTIQLTWNKKFDLPYPDLRASTDSAIIAKGKYLAYGPAHCASCHAPEKLVTAAFNASSVEEYRRIVGNLDGVQLSGGFSYPFELGTLYFPNLTPDPETGIGRYTDGQLARVLRHGVKPNGEALFPIMEYQNISDEDVVALLSFLRSQPPVHNPVPDNHFTLFGKGVKAFLIRPIQPDGMPPAVSPPEEATIERGEYLANRVAQCAQCHTRRNMVDFSLEGPRFAGGMELNEAWAPEITFVPPNLTPDPHTGHIVNWSEDQFVQRFRSGTLILGTPMDWEMFGRMSDTDLRSIYRYLMSLQPVENATGPTVKPRNH